MKYKEYIVKIAAGIVSYNPKIERLENNIKAIFGQVDVVLIVDNNSQNIVEIKKMLKKYKVLLMENDDNKGIATALNQLMIKAKNEGCDWVLTLDQDTVCEEDLVYQYKKILNNYASNIAIICPNIFETQTNKMVKRVKKDVEEVDRCITSAALTNIVAWQNVGGFDDKLFIDYVDYDFCEKLHKKNYLILMTNKTIINHELGNSKLRRFIIWKVRVSNYSPFRKYYIARNLIIYIRRHCGCKKAILEILRIARFILFVIIYEKNSMVSLKAIIRGIIDGINFNVA